MDFGRWRERHPFGADPPLAPRFFFCFVGLDWEKCGRGGYKRH